MPGRPGIGISAPNRNPALRSGSRKRETAAENGKPRSPYVRFGRNFASTGPNNSIYQIPARCANGWYNDR